MPFNMNFDTPLQLVNGTVTVNGSSEVLGEDTELISRHVALQQGANVIKAPANLALKWATNAIPAPGFKGGENVLALGSEVHFVPDPPTFVSGTWAQILELEDA